MTNRREITVAPAAVHWGRRLARVAAVAVVGAVAAVLLALTLVKPLDHDEYMYVAAGDLLRQGAGLPYRDFPFLQMPVLELVYAAVFLGTDHLLLAARLLNTLAFIGSLAVLFALIWRAAAPAGYAVRLLAGSATILLVAGNGPVTFASGLAWNHDLPVLLTLLALACFVGGPGSRRRIGLVGALLGLAVGARLAFLPALLPFLAAVLWPPGPVGQGSEAGNISRRFRFRTRRAAGFLAGLLLGLAPTLVLAALAPSRFLFDNVTYHSWNAVYYQTLGHTEAMTLADKLSTIRDLLLAQPACLALLVLYLLFAVPVLVWALAHGRLAAHLPLALATMLVPCLLVGALVPTPTWYQYFYAPVPFTALGAGRGLAAIAGAPGPRRALRALVCLAALWIGAGEAFANGQQVYSGYLQSGNVWSPANWVPVQVHQVGEEMRRMLAAQRGAAAGGPVLTLMPLFPLEGGLPIYPAFAAGPFAWRVAPLLPRDQRAAAGLVGPDELAAVGPAGPAALLTGGEGALDDPLIAYAQAHGYRPLRLSNGFTLWLR